MQSEVFGTVEFDEKGVRENLPEVFNIFDNVDKILNEIPVDRNKLKHFSNYQEYYKWTELMKVSFLATQGIPKYDVNMNNALRTLIVTGIVEQADMRDLVESSEILQSLQSINK